MVFFRGGKNDLFRDRLNEFCMVILNFGKFSKFEECQTIIKENRISIHVKREDNFFDSNNSQEKIYDFMLRQQDCKKKKI